MNEFYDQVAYIERWIENFMSAEGTDSAVDYCIKLYLNVAKYEPLKGSNKDISIQKGNNQCQKL